MKAAIHVGIGECPKVFILMTTEMKKRKMKDGKKEDMQFICGTDYCYH